MIKKLLPLALLSLTLIPEISSAGSRERVRSWLNSDTETVDDHTPVREIPAGREVPKMKRRRAVNRRCKPNCFFHGFYVGEGIGVSLNHSDLDSDSSGTFFVTTIELPGTIRNRESVDLFNYRLYGEVFGGWSYQLCSGFNLGLQLGANFSSYDISRTDLYKHEQIESIELVVLEHEVKERVKLRTIDYTLDARIGWTLCQKTLFFALLGVSYNRPELSINGFVNHQNHIRDPFEIITQIQTSARETSSDRRLNFHTGLGIEQRLTCNLGTYLRYTCTNYGSHSSTLTNSNTVADAGTVEQTISTHYHPYRHALTVGLTHHF